MSDTLFRATTLNIRNDTAIKNRRRRFGYSELTVGNSPITATEPKTPSPIANLTRLMGGPASANIAFAM